MSNKAKMRIFMSIVAVVTVLALLQGFMADGSKKVGSSKTLRSSLAILLQCSVRTRVRAAGRGAFSRRPALTEKRCAADDRYQHRPYERAVAALRAAYGRQRS